MKRKPLDLILTQPTQLGVVTVVTVVVTQQIPAGVTPVAATALEAIALEVIPVEVMGPGVTVQIAVERAVVGIEVTPLEGVIVTPTTLEVIPQVVYDVRESVGYLLAMSVSLAVLWRMKMVARHAMIPALVRASNHCVCMIHIDSLTFNFFSRSCV